MALDNCPDLEAFPNWAFLKLRLLVRRKNLLAGFYSRHVTSSDIELTCVAESRLEMKEGLKDTEINLYTSCQRRSQPTFVHIKPTSTSKCRVPRPPHIEKENPCNFCLADLTQLSTRLVVCIRISKVELQGTTSENMWGAERRERADDRHRRV